MVLAADELHRQLALVDLLGWDSQPGEDLLAAVRSSIVTPLVRRTGLTGPDARQAEATGWATAWEVLRRPSARVAENPAGMLWVAVRRAVHAEVRALRAPAPEQLGVRVPVDLAEQRTAPGIHGVDWDECPAGPGESPEGPVGELMGPVIGLLVDVGWDRGVVLQVVVELAEAAARHGGSGRERGPGWRRVARARGLAEWQVRRLAALLLGGSGARGLLWLLLREGPGILDDPAVRAAVHATTHRWSATPEEHLRAFGEGPSPAGAGQPTADRYETSICKRTWTKRTVPLDRAPVGAPGARAAGPTSASHGGFEGRHGTRTHSPAPNSSEYP